MGRDADARSSDEAAGDRGADDSRGDDHEQQDGNADVDTAEQAADGEDVKQDAAADGAANGTAGDRKRSRSRSRERQGRDGSQDKRRCVASCMSDDTCALCHASFRLLLLYVASLPSGVGFRTMPCIPCCASQRPACLSTRPCNMVPMSYHSRGSPSTRLCCAVLCC